MLEPFGAVCFGLVVGWLTHRTVRRKGTRSEIKDLAAVVGVIGGGTVLALFQDKALFAAYAIGMAAGFFGYLIVAYCIDGKKVGGWMEAESVHPAAGSPQPGGERGEVIWKG